MHKFYRAVTDISSEEVDETEPLFQMLLNSHSPVVLACLEQGEALFADLVSVVKPEAGTVSRKTRIRPVMTFQRESKAESELEYVSRFEVDRYFNLLQNKINFTNNLRDSTEVSSERL